MRRLCIRTPLLAVVALAWTSIVLGAPVKEEKKDKPAPTSAEKIRKELDQVISLDIDEQPLHLAVNQLKEQTKINFVLDKVTLAALGMDPEQTTVKLKLKDVKLRTALRTLFTPYGLSWAILEDSVLISTEEMAIQRQLRQRVSLDLEKVEFAKALRQLARETATNLVVDPRVGKEAQALVTLQLDDVPLETAVRLMAETVSLKPVKVGNVLFVCSKANAAELRADPDINPQPLPMMGEKDGPAILPGWVRPGVIGPATPTPVKPADAARPADVPGEKPAEKPAPADKPLDKPRPK